MIISIPTQLIANIAACPFTKATLAAWQVLTTPESIQWYKETLVKLYQLIVTLSIATIALGRATRVTLERFRNRNLLALPPAPEPQETQSDSIETQPEPITIETTITEETTPAQPDVAQTQPTITEEPQTDSESLSKLTLSQLRKRLDELGIVYHKKADKAHLMGLLLIAA